ncbi:UDP-N-acetylglucosamine 2-epimerase (non-hydrolyzing) [Geothrix oryzae]|uniref:UDP-N-acetylglucosamine 2-epimerase (non-hydrolyzing) n=1 Tax=Geothrix oryzae TaxID=2927975 RepID=A0ABM8DPB5_9BACT|nr:UDP-N-acetylglucosamine 2-epimerase (non-hydrolyzing) [Geothrix oryzae]BDU68786.1 UDP-N-acetylglucosamine 2-epimerase (non-hydrolyzing) [Geothrix oryzae]
MSKKVICVMGTRPEVIKMAPVVKALSGMGLDVKVLATAQHRGMLDQMMATFQLSSDWDLDAMRPGQSLPDLTGRLVPALAKIFQASNADAVLAQGDTTTVFCSALAAYYSSIPFGHVEAGLRSGDLKSPFPEEGMRRLTAPLANWHFAPTETSRLALLKEGTHDSNIHVVGNTVIDALLATSARADLALPPTLRPLEPGHRRVLITLHRRENFGEPLRAILGSLRRFALRHPSARLVYPVHPNPNVQGPAWEILGGLPNVDLIEPLDYPELVAVMREAHLVLTDSGGIQEEAPAIGKPVLVFRDVTERPEAVEAGGVRLVGSDPARFEEEVERLWTDEQAYADMAKPRFPYGDGRSSLRISEILGQDLKLTLSA